MTRLLIGTYNYQGGYRDGAFDMQPLKQTVAGLDTPPTAILIRLTDPTASLWPVTRDSMKFTCPRRRGGTGASRVAGPDDRPPERRHLTPSLNAASRAPAAPFSFRCPDLKSGRLPIARLVGVHQDERAIESELRAIEVSWLQVAALEVDNLASPHLRNVAHFGGIHFRRKSYVRHCCFNSFLQRHLIPPKEWTKSLGKRRSPGAVTSDAHLITAAHHTSRNDGSSRAQAARFVADPREGRST
jgi:hypothetical protein